LGADTGEGAAAAFGDAGGLGGAGRYHDFCWMPTQTRVVADATPEERRITRPMPIDLHTFVVFVFMRRRSCSVHATL
jgi:hypothetical protein